MSDTVFTPDERGTAPDPVTKRPGHRTENIVLADDVEYSLAGKRQDGFQEITSKINQPFEGTFKVSFNSDEDAQSYRVKKADVAATAWDISTNVLTVTLADSTLSRFKRDQFITLSGFPSASVFPAAGKNTALQITEILTATTFTAALTSGDASATEAFTVNKSDVEMDADNGETIFNSRIVADIDYNLGVLRPGRYRVQAPGLTGAGANVPFEAWYVSDGTTISLDVMVVGTVTEVQPFDSYDDADSASKVALFVSGGDLVITNGTATTTKLRVDYYSSRFEDTDTDGAMCFFEKDGDLIIKNRTGASQTCAIESIEVRIASRLAASPNQLPAEHPQA